MRILIRLVPSEPPQESKGKQGENCHQEAQGQGMALLSLCLCLSLLRDGRWPFSHYLSVSLSSCRAQNSRALLQGQQRPPTCNSAWQGSRSSVGDPGDTWPMPLAPECLCQTRTVGSQCTGPSSTAHGRCLPGMLGVADAGPLRHPGQGPSPAAQSLLRQRRGSRAGWLRP